VTCASCGCGDKFETERFETKINLRIHQAAGMNGEEFHLFGTNAGLFGLFASPALFRSNKRTAIVFFAWRSTRARIF